MESSSILEREVKSNLKPTEIKWNNYTFELYYMLRSKGDRTYSVQQFSASVTI